MIFFVFAIVYFTGYFNCNVIAAEQNDVKRVLILNSYNREMTWTSEETQGIMDTLSKSRQNINISVENMDWKNFPTQQNLKYLYEYYKYKYQNKKIDLILATDDAALSFTLKNRKELFSNAPVVFCGVNQEGADTITRGYDNLTGVIEVIDPSETIQLAFDINPSIKNLYLLYDNTDSGKSTGKLVIDKVESRYPDLKIVSMNNMSYQDVINTVQNLGHDDVFMITTYSSDMNNKIMDMNYVIRNVSDVSSVPVYHLFNFGMDNGAIGGVLLSGIKEGNHAATLALRVLEGEDPDDISFQIPEATRSVMNYQQMERYGISIKDIPKDFEIVNKPFSFYETYKTLIYIVLSIIVTLILFINVLIFYITKIRRMKKNLAENHEELTQLYEELTASDEEMKQQYDEIIVINEKIRIGEEQLSYRAYHDALTGLPNKLSLFENAKDIFHQDRGIVAVLFVDIDNFKNVNDTMGHAFGDQLIEKVSKRLTSLLSDEDLIYRLGGDEFIVILQNLCGYQDVQKASENIISKFSQEFDIDGSILYISVSIGIAMFPDHAMTIDQLLKYADIAMYKVKETGKTNYLLYNSWMNELFIERANIEKHLPKALDNNEFELFYQPQFDLKSKKITGFEALLRWHSPELGEVSPVKFIKIAEDNKLIIPIGKWVMKQACDFIKRIHLMGYGDMSISVNVSIIQLVQSDFCDIVYQTLEQTELEAKFLELEITETILIESFERVGDELNRLNERDIKIVLDDFGKGYSSLNYLMKLPISTLKVDKAFVDSIIDNCDNKLTGQIVTLGKSMGMTIVAEGVETQEQLDYLLRYDCDKLQGYLFSRPKPEVDIVKLLQMNEKAY